MQNREEIIQEQKAWIESGAIGCVFASCLVKQAYEIGWIFDTWELSDEFILDNLLSCGANHNMWSAIFPGADIHTVREWALRNGFYIEIIYGDKIYEDGSNDVYEGLRIKLPEGVAWVQYFGPDSHVKTRRAPHPMLSFTVKLPAHVYAKTMIQGILHLAHASIEFLTAAKCHTLWNRSIAQTKKILGHSPDKSQAAKVTFLKND